jgi:hypothetical protein
MVIRCEEVWVEVSNYLDGDIAPDLRAAMDQHFSECKRCASVLEGTRNVVQLYGDERMAQVPLGFSYRLHRRLEGNMPGNRRRFLGWMVAAAAAAVTAGAVKLASSVSRGAEPRSEHARQGTNVPPDLIVVVSDAAKLFHLPECSVIHDRAHMRTVTARDAQQQGFVPCVRCLGQYVTT